MSSPQWFGTGALVEQAGSPSWEFGEEIRATTIYRGDYEIARASCPRKGALGTGDYAGLKVERAMATREKGGVGVLTITYAGIPTGEDENDVPEDEAEISYTDETIALEKHVAFADLDQDDVRAAYIYANAKTQQEINDTAWIFTEAYDGDDELQALTLRLLRGVENFLLGLPIYRYTSYFVYEPVADAGGYAETPSGPLTPPAGYDWLRKPDVLTTAGAYYKLTRTWQGTYNLDPYLYS
jgi:hypothetical protein